MIAYSPTYQNFGLNMMVMFWPAHGSYPAFVISSPTTMLQGIHFDLVGLLHSQSPGHPLTTSRWLDTGHQRLSWFTCTKTWSCYRETSWGNHLSMGLTLHHDSISFLSTGFPSIHPLLLVLLVMGHVSPLTCCNQIIGLGHSCYCPYPAQLIDV